MARGRARAPMRSSIACVRCRKSKIKCDNDGGAKNACDTCVKTGKECNYPQPGVNTPKRAEPPAKQERDGPNNSTAGRPEPDRKRFRRLEEFSKAETERAPHYAEEALSQGFLTEELWDSLFQIYKLHFSTELPFLHIPTLKEKISDRLRGKLDMSPDTNLILLGVLTLTGRYHQGLVKYVANQVNPGTGSARSRPVYTKFEPTEASEYYCDILTRSLGGFKHGISQGSVERVQVFLMLGLYEWMQSGKDGGLCAWMYVGIAIRMAQALGLGYGDKQNTRSRATSHEKPGRNTNNFDLIKIEEIKRRTMFSCLILDRMMSCGPNRVSTIQSGDLQIRLPCSEEAFDFSKDVFTGFLGDHESSHPIEDDSVLSRFIRLVDLWGSISKFSFSGGRRTEEHPPWDPRTTFHKLVTDLDRFQEDLPPAFRFKRSNYYRHERHQSVYVSLHMLCAVCRIMIHREYIPYIPANCRGPIGPLDEPRFDPGEYEIPELFWEDNAAQVFAAARIIVDLIDMCQPKDKLPQSSLVVFSVWTAAFVGIYACHFPHMDTNKCMVEGMDGVPWDEFSKVGPTGIAYQALAKMALLNKFATRYIQLFNVHNRCYHQHKQSIIVSRQQDTADGTPKLLSLRQVGDGGGGLDEWKQVSGEIMGNGSLLPARPVDSDFKREDGKRNVHSLRRSLGDQNSPEDSMTVDQGSPSQDTSSGGFKAINSKSGAEPRLQDVAQQAIQFDGSLGGNSNAGYPIFQSIPHVAQVSRAILDEGHASPQTGDRWEERTNDMWMFSHGYTPDYQLDIFGNSVHIDTFTHPLPSLDMNLGMETASYPSPDKQVKQGE